MKNIVWSNNIDKVLKHGITLEPIGVRNWALSKHEALIALEQLKELKIPVLGGDVCQLVDNIVECSYDNWYCKRLINESDNEFLERSVEKAVNYIENYKNGKSEEIFFSFVPYV